MYESIYNFICEQIHEIPTAKEIEMFARYNFKLSDILYSATKFVEYVLRATIKNHCSNEPLTETSYCYQMNNVLSGGTKQVPSNIKASRKDEKFFDYLDRNDLATLIKCFVSLDEAKAPISDNTFEELDIIRCLRNDIAHCKAIFSKRELKKVIFTVFKFTPSEQTVNHRIDEINNLYNQYYLEVREELRGVFIQIVNEDIDNIVENKFFTDEYLEYKIGA